VTWPGVRARRPTWPSWGSRDMVAPWYHLAHGGRRLRRGRLPRDRAAVRQPGRAEKMITEAKTSASDHHRRVPNTARTSSMVRRALAARPARASGPATNSGPARAPGGAPATTGISMFGGPAWKRGTEGPSAASGTCTCSRPAARLQLGAHGVRAEFARVRGLVRTRGDGFRIDSAALAGKGSGLATWRDPHPRSSRRRGRPG